jgi:peptidoglycan/LPS O-acetylase OafA/YrhL
MQAAGEFHGELAPDPKDIVGHFILFCNFIGGAAAYLWRDRAKLTFLSIVFALAVIIISFNSSAFYFLTPIATVYLTICFGMIKFPKIPVLSGGDYSYGIYLYGWPVQQTIMHYFPAYRTWYFNLALAAPITVTIAFLSWNILEKRVLYLKNHPQMRRFMTYPIRHHSRVAIKLLMERRAKLTIRSQ